jgi:hypothetical protein
MFYALAFHISLDAKFILLVTGQFYSRKYFFHQVTNSDLLFK